MISELREEPKEEEIRELIAICNAHDGTRYGADEADFSLGIPDEGGAGLSSLLLVYRLGETFDGLAMDEVAAFTLPGRRKQGLFRRLLNEAGSRLSPVLRFSVYPNPDALAALGSLGAEHLYDECLMELPLESLPESPRRLPEEVSEEEEEDGSYWRGRHAELYTRPLGDAVYIFGVLTDGRHRREGHAFRLLTEVLLRERERGARRAVLQVSSENRPAFLLYRKLGFSLRESLMQFRLAFRNA